MTPSWRKPFGALLILALIAAWVVAVVTLLEKLPALANPVTYVVAGIVWIWLLPLRKLLAWMETGRWR